ncbi:MAG: RluA family pseudouridine synthase [Gammaproteobacteria bacterium]|nr:RluA family pseudouridine synthase [Gammaproteobacteria bacterium]
MSRAPQQKIEVQKLTVEPADAGRRLDNFISSHLKNIPKSRIYQMLRRGEVRVNGGRSRQDYRLEDGDIVRIPPVHMEPATAVPAVATAVAERLLGRILYEDNQLLVLDKPAGLAVHGGSGIVHGVIEILRAGRPEIQRLELVHRLDRETSGCLLLTKDMTVLRSLHDQLRAGTVRKGYTALLEGRMERRSLAVDAPLGRQKNRAGERLVIVDAAGKPSATHIKRRQVFGDATLADVSLLTGRTHQIRVHAAAASHPLAGDTRIRRSWV